MDWFYDVENAAEWMREFGLWAIVVSLLLNVVISVLGIVPSLFLSGANAVVFGLVPGFFISLIGEALGAAVSFFLYRKGFRKLQAVRNETWRWLQKLNGGSRKQQWMTVLLMRLTPFIPSGVITFATAVSRMSFTDFISASAIGKAPSVFLETLAGHDLVFMKGNMPRLAITLILLGLILLLWNKNRKKERKTKRWKMME